MEGLHVDLADSCASVCSAVKTGDAAMPERCSTVSDNSVSGVFVLIALGGSTKYGAGNRVAWPVVIIAPVTLARAAAGHRVRLCESAVGDVVEVEFELDRRHRVRG